MAKLKHLIEQITSPATRLVKNIILEYNKLNNQTDEITQESFNNGDKTAAPKPLFLLPGETHSITEHYPELTPFVLPGEDPADRKKALTPKVKGPTFLLPCEVGSCNTATKDLPKLTTTSKPRFELVSFPKTSEPTTALNP